MNPARRLMVVALALAPLAGACAKAPPRTRPEPPAATAPVLPPAPLPLPATVLDLPAADLPSVPPPVSVAERITASAAADRPAEPPARRPEAPPEPPKQEPPPQQDPPRLGTPETADVEVATRQVGETLDRARASLGRVRSDRLTGDARVQYQTVRLLIEQAEAAIEAKNFMYAMRLADKAEKLARQLAGQG